MEIGSKLKEARMRTEFTQEQVSDAIGVSRQTLSNWENENIMPSVDMLIKIAKYFNVTTDYLLGLSEKHTLNSDGLSDLQISHIQTIIDDILQ